MTGDESAKAFEFILQKTRPFGFYQKRLFLLTSFLQCLCWTNIIYLDFIHQQSIAAFQNVCLVSPITTNRSDQFPNRTSEAGIVDVQSRYSNCKNTSDTEWSLPEWMNQDPVLYEYVWYGQGAGIVAGCLAGGFFGDFVGRRIVMFFMFGCMSLSQGLLVIYHHWVYFMVLRSSVGLFASGFMITSTVLVVEHVGKNWRDVTVCTCLWVFGAVMLSLEGLITKHWMYLAIVTAVISLPFTGIYFIFPESFRWYACRERFAESEAAIREVTSCNTTTLPDMTSVCDKARLAVLNSMHKRTHTFMDLFHTSVLLKHTIVIIFGWFISCVVYRCLLERMFNLTGNCYVDVCLSFCIDLPIIYSAVIINKCLGRRWCLFLFATSSGCAMMCIIVLHITNNLDEDRQMVTSISVFGKMGVSSCVALIALISVEIYPTTIRCMGVSVGLVSGICGCAVGRHLFQFFSKNFHYTLPFIGYGVLMMLVGFSALIFTETKDIPLPDIVPSRHRMIGMKEVTRSMNAWENKK